MVGFCGAGVDRESGWLLEGKKHPDRGERERGKERQGGGRADFTPNLTFIPTALTSAWTIVKRVQNFTLRSVAYMFALLRFSLVAADPTSFCLNEENDST